MKMNKPKSAAFNRRQMLLAGAIAGGASFVGPRRALAASSLPVRGSGPEIYSRFGVKPFINCTSTYTINGGSAMLPEVIEAMNDASYYPVNFDELMEGAGKRLAELLQKPGAAALIGKSTGLAAGFRAAPAAVFDTHETAGANSYRRPFLSYADQQSRREPA